ncbi:Uncharacterised protein [Halioglobus japonicus]|nr:Uncharacterised protein [Halioglobus japonicus]
MTALTLAADSGYAANIDNLTGLWQHFGCIAGSVTDNTRLYWSTSWPRRAWIDPRAQPEQLSYWMKAIETAPTGSVFVVWDIEQTAEYPWHARMDSLGLAPQSTLTGMIMPAAETDCSAEDMLTVQTITDCTHARHWAQLCGRCFGYRIDENVIARVLGNPNIWLMVGVFNGKPAATTLLYRSHDTVGVHQVGVDPEHRGLGIARAMMRSALSLAKEHWRPSLFVLQASEAGRGLYEQLGFRQQFKLELFHSIQE